MTAEQKIRKIIREELLKEAVGTPRQTVEKLIAAVDSCQKDLQSMNAASLIPAQRKLSAMRKELVDIASKW